jgi:hypothetical protein
MVALSTFMVPIGVLSVASVAFGGTLPRNSELVARSCNPEPPVVAGKFNLILSYLH